MGSVAEYSTIQADAMQVLQRNGATIATAYDTEGGRLVVIPASTARAYFIEDGDGASLALHRHGGDYIARAGGAVQLYKRPHPATLHAVAMAHARSVNHHNAVATQHGGAVDIKPIEHHRGRIARDIAELVAKF